VSNTRNRITRSLCTAAAGAALLAVPAVAGHYGEAGGLQDHRTLAQPCVNGVVPLNPYVVNCNLGPRPPKIRGSAPDAGAIIACRHDPVCLSYYVNNP
jgi:hypothetical protein